MIGPLRIGIVIPYDISEAGGGVKHHALQLAAELRRMGDDVTLFAPASAPPHAPHVVGFPGVIHARSNGSDNRMGLFVRPWTVGATIRRHRFDVLHIHEPLVPSLTYWASWLSPGVPKVATFHAFAESPPIQLRVGQRIWGRTLYPFLRKGIAVSAPAARYASIAWKKPFEIIPNGVSCEVFSPDDALPRHRDAALKLLFVGKLCDERKGFEYLLQAYRILRANGAAVSLDVVGELGGVAPPPPMDGLTYHGALSLHELVRRYRACDVFVAPSTSQESFGIVLLEAMACARPIVCSDIEGYREVADPRGARLVPPRNAQALADAIAALCVDAHARRTMSIFNRRHVERFDWRAVAPRVREVYLDALGVPRETHSARAHAHPRTNVSIEAPPDAE